LYLQHNLFLENTSIYYNEKPRHEVSLVWNSEKNDV
jgi:hypothetical protein